MHQLREGISNVRKYRFRFVGTNDYTDEDADMIFVHGDAIAYVGPTLSNEVEFVLLEGTRINKDRSTISLIGKDYPL